MIAVDELLDRLASTRIPLFHTTGLKLEMISSIRQDNLLRAREIGVPNRSLMYMEYTVFLGNPSLRLRD